MVEFPSTLLSLMRIALSRNATAVLTYLTLVGWKKHKMLLRYGSCRYNERQLIDVTVVRRVRPRAEHNVRTYRFLPADTRYIVSGT